MSQLLLRYYMDVSGFFRYDNALHGYQTFGLVVRVKAVATNVTKCYQFWKMRISSYMYKVSQVRLRDEFIGLDYVSDITKIH